MSDKIDFENIKWGSFTKQFKAYRNQYPKSRVKDLDAFAKMVLRNPKKFQPRTQKRASFYLNVILPPQSARGGGVYKDEKTGCVLYTGGGESDSDEEEGGGTGYSKEKVAPLEPIHETPIQSTIRRSVGRSKMRLQYAEAEIKQMTKKGDNESQDFLDMINLKRHEENYLRKPYHKKIQLAIAEIARRKAKREGGANGDSDDEGETDHEDNSDDEEENDLALPHFWDGNQWVLAPQQPPLGMEDDEILEGGMYRKMYQSALTGGKLSISSLKGLLNKSYDKKPENYLEYEVDKELSGQRVQVYKNKKTGEVVVSHRGTQGIHDIGNDLKYALGFDLKNTERFKHAEDIQRKAEAKYGAKNITTIGHSLGSKLARDVGQNSKEVIELNPAYNIPDALKKKSDNTYSIRTKYDPVSFLVPFFKKDKNTTTLESKTLNPLAEHTVNVLDRADQDKEIGAGFKKKSLRELKALAKKLPKEHRIKLTKVKKNDLLSHLCKCGGFL